MVQTIMRLRSLGSRYFRYKHATLNIFLYHREAHQMPETIKQKALQLEPVLGSYGACKISHTFSYGEAVKLQAFEVTE